MAGKGEGGGCLLFLVTVACYIPSLALKFFMSCKLRICNDIFYNLNKCCFWIMPSQAICIT